MSPNDIFIGSDAPKVVNVLVEIPSHSAPVKYEVDKNNGFLRVDRFLSTAMFYPCNYGYLPQTLSNDGDPLDALILSPVPVISGCLIRCRPIDILRMSDEAGEDNKLLVVPVSNVTALYDKVFSAEDVPLPTTNQIVHFFAHYKDLEPNKWTKVDAWGGTAAALAEVEESIMRWKTNKK